MSIFHDERALKNAIIEIPLSAPEYPSALKELSNPPERLYAVGELSLLQETKLAVVGSRRTPPNALKLGGEIAKALSPALVILTGVADGGDSAAIEGALAGSGRVICVLAGGFSALPQSQIGLLERVIKRGLVLSFHPFEQEIRAYSYEVRNKLLAKLSDGVLVLGAGEKSGALITAKYAKSFKKRLFALPYPPNAAAGVGCNGIIKQGGYLTECAADVATVYGLKLSERKAESPLSAEEGKLLEALREELEAHVEVLAAKAGLPVFKAKALLSALEVKGKTVSTGGNRYAIV